MEANLVRAGCAQQDSPPYCTSERHRLFVHSEEGARPPLASLLPQESCCQSQHTYVHAQLLLRELARHPRGARFRRLSQASGATVLCCAVLC